MKKLIALILILLLTLSTLTSCIIINVKDIIDILTKEEEEETNTVMTDSGILSNEGKGLPDGTDGIYNIDFTKSTATKSVSGLKDHKDGCPTVGSPKVLVIPIEFTDASASKYGFTISSIERAFKGVSSYLNYYSLYDYYYRSSMGKLDLDITILNYWFVPEHTSDYYKNATIEYNGETKAIGDQMIMDEALRYLESRMDLSEFDSDGNGFIDAVVLVNSLNVDEKNDFNWAYQYWNIYSDEENHYYQYDGVSANDYIWMSCGFLHPMYSTDKYYTSRIDTYTLIHEFGHILGAPDYYDTEVTIKNSDDDPLRGLDVMDSTPGDHNPFTKIHYGWITESRLVTTDSEISVVLQPFSKTGDTIILANDWDESLGAYQEYYIIAYYTDTELNGEINGNNAGYCGSNCILVYHVNASLYFEEYGDDCYYYLNNDNTSSNDNAPDDNLLLEYVLEDKDYSLRIAYTNGSTMADQTDDTGELLGYTFTVNYLSSGGAKITITKATE